MVNSRILCRKCGLPLTDYQQASYVRSNTDKPSTPVQSVHADAFLRQRGRLIGSDTGLVMPVRLVSNGRLHRGRDKSGCCSRKLCTHLVIDTTMCYPSSRNMCICEHKGSNVVQRP